MRAWFLSALLLAASSASAQDRWFGGNLCTDDCSGHRAGYEWAKRKGIRSTLDCGGNSLSFKEGCRTYALEPYRGSDTDDEGRDLDE